MQTLPVHWVVLILGACPGEPAKPTEQARRGGNGFRRPHLAALSNSNHALQPSKLSMELTSKTRIA
jgi:hypothetical protein